MISKYRFLKTMLILLTLIAYKVSALSYDFYSSSFKINHLLLQPTIMDMGHDNPGFLGVYERSFLLDALRVGLSSTYQRIDEIDWVSGQGSIPIGVWTKNYTSLYISVGMGAEEDFKGIVGIDEKGNPVIGFLRKIWEGDESYVSLRTPLIAIGAGYTYKSYAPDLTLLANPIFSADAREDLARDNVAVLENKIHFYCRLDILEVIWKPKSLPIALEVTNAILLFPYITWNSGIGLSW